MSAADHDETHHRNRSIRLAVVTSLFSKFGTVILRLISIPVAFRVLGKEEFGVYAAITMAVGMIDTFHVGIGPALTRAIAKAVAAKDRAREEGVFATSLLLSAGLTLFIGAILALLVVFVPIPTLFGAKFAPFAATMQRACGLAIVVIVVELICLVCERARDGYQETRFNNTWGAGGNFLGAGMLLIGVRFLPTVEFLVLAINGTLALAKLSNTIHLFVQRPYLWPRFSRFRRDLVKPLLLDGGRFSITYLLSALIEYNIFAYLIGRVSGPEAIAVYNVMITVHFSLTGVVQMVTIPLWPALVNAHSKGDYAWIRHSARRIRLMGPAFGLAVGLGLTTLGTWAFPLWMGEEFHISRAALATFSAYFFLHIWRHVNQVVVLGLGLIDACVKTLVAEASISLALVAFVLWTGGNLATVYGVLALCLLGATGWIFPLLSVREQMRLETGPAGAPDTVPEAGFEAPVTPESVVA